MLGSAYSVYNAISYQYFEPSLVDKDYIMRQVIYLLCLIFSLSTYAALVDQPKTEDRAFSDAELEQMLAPNANESKPRQSVKAKEKNMSKRRQDPRK